MRLIQKFTGGDPDEGRARQAGRHAAGRRRRSASRSTCSRWRRSCCSIYAARKAHPGHAFSRARPLLPPVRGGLRVRGDAGPGQGHRRRARRHAEARADGPAGLRRRGLRQDRGGDARRLQGRRSTSKQVAVLVPTTVLAQQHYLSFKKRFDGLPGHHRGDLAACRRPPRCARSLQARAGGQGRHPHRHPQAAGRRRGLQGPGPAGRRRGAALRREAEGAAQEAAHPGGRAHAHRHAHPAHAATWRCPACAT